ncbi:Protein transport protein bos1 [Elasticomyces elasticus]|nr:Protein transport protein bos1 [Elasticomyces elasticus]
MSGPIFNQLLRQSTVLRTSLDELSTTTTNLTPASLGQLTTSLTSFSRTLDDYARLTRQELVAAKKAKAEERLATFRAELSDHRDRFDALKAESERRREGEQRGELFGGRRAQQSASTPENPYASANGHDSGGSGAGISVRQTNPLFRANGNNADWKPSAHNPYSAYASSPTQQQQQQDPRETAAFRERNFFGQANDTLDEYLERGRTVMTDLHGQREVLKGTQKKLYSVANTLGVSGETIRMVNRRAKQDKFVFGAGCAVFVVFVWVVLRYLK